MDVRTGLYLKANAVNTEAFLDAWSMGVTTLNTTKTSAWSMELPEKHVPHLSASTMHSRGACVYVMGLS